MYAESESTIAAPETPARSSRWVLLEVGGIPYKTTVETLTRNDNGGFFSNLLSANWNEGQCTSQQPICIDRDGKAFRYVLNWLRNNKVNLPQNSALVQDISDEADYFCLESLVQICKKRLSSLENEKLHTESWRCEALMCRAEAALCRCEALLSQQGAEQKPMVEDDRKLTCKAAEANSPVSARCGSERPPLSLRLPSPSHTSYLTNALAPPLLLPGNTSPHSPDARKRPRPPTPVSAALPYTQTTTTTTRLQPYEEAARTTSSRSSEEVEDWEGHTAPQVRANTVSVEELGPMLIEGEDDF